jgi:dihydroorotate dehydrogenase (fumarate)
MTDLSTTYLGFKLNSPMIVGSSGLTDKPEKIKELEKHGAGAVVLKSIFEEEILMEYDQILKQEAPGRYKDDYLDYFDYKIKEANLEKYLSLIVDSKKAVSIPVIASINCTSSHEWTYFARKIEDAGADAIELNVFLLPSNLDKSAEDTERTYLEIIQMVRNEVKIPVSVKMSYYFANLASFIQELSRTNIAGLVLFNRTYNPDIDIEKMEVTASHVLSTPQEISISLRWVAIMANRIQCDLAASTGVHTGEGAIKQLLAGANAVQIVSALYEKGPEYLATVISDIKKWMEKKGYQKLDDFRGIMSQERAVNPSLFERVQFMKYFSDRDKQKEVK